MFAGISDNDWSNVLRDEFDKPYFVNLMKFLEAQYNSTVVYPEPKNIFAAQQMTDYSEVRVVVLGQDPYHGPNQAHGLSFSVQHGQPIPPSLKNIYKELVTDCGCSAPSHGCLTSWAQHGVLLLNTVLTVRQGQPNSHRNQGWERYTNRVIEVLNERTKPVIFLLWGNQAHSKRQLITNSRHFMLVAPHPSPLSAHRGFFGSRPFSQINAILRELGEPEIEWQP